VPSDKDDVGSMEVSATSAVHQTTVNLCHSKTFRREIIPNRLDEIPARKQMDSRCEVAFVRLRNVKSHRRFSIALKSSTRLLLFSAYNATVRSHENLSQMDYCRSSAW
jgi:hypothetical protein